MDGLGGELGDLLAQLQTTQRRAARARLSERNVVELVSKLKALGVLGDDLLHTINGKEYITPDRLKADVARALAAAGGRLELSELPALVGVDLTHCEKQARLLLLPSRLHHPFGFDFTLLLLLHLLFFCLAVPCFDSLCGCVSAQGCTPAPPRPRPTPAPFAPAPPPRAAPRPPPSWLSLAAPSLRRAGS
jgi:hypothetical protein